MDTVRRRTKASARKSKPRAGPHPLDKWMGEQGVTPAQLHRRSGVGLNRLSDVLCARSRFFSRTDALRLEAVTGLSFKLLVCPHPLPRVRLPKGEPRAA